MRCGPRAVAEVKDRTDMAAFGEGVRRETAFGEIPRKRGEIKLVIVKYSCVFYWPG